jgi:SnoaL-like domain
VSTSDLAQDPGYFTKYKNFAVSRSASGVLTLRFHTSGGPHTFDGTTHHDFPRLLEDIAFDTDNRILVLTGTGDSFIVSIDGPSLGDITKPMGADVLYVEGRRGVQRLADLEIPIIAAVNGRAEVRRFYEQIFIGHWPADTTMERVSRTVGSDQVVDELVLSFTHDIPMGHLLPGVPPTGKRVRLAVCVVAGFRDGRLSHEHIYWDQASVLVQVGLLDPAGLPVAGAEQAEKLLNPRAIRANALRCWTHDARRRQ